MRSTVEANGILQLMMTMMMMAMLVLRIGASDNLTKGFKHQLLFNR